MPKGDVLWQRLEAASDDGRKAVADALGLVARDTASLSEAIRKEAGSFLGNLFRQTHELSYEAILCDCAREAKTLAMLPHPSGNMFQGYEATEHFIHRMLDFVERRLRQPLTARQWLDEMRESQAELLRIPASEVVAPKYWISKAKQDLDSPPHILWHYVRHAGYSYVVTVAPDIAWAVDTKKETLKSPKLSPLLRAVHQVIKFGNSSLRKG
jgi:hypothetical protein